MYIKTTEDLKGQIEEFQVFRKNFVGNTKFSIYTVINARIYVPTSNYDFLLLFCSTSNFS